MINKKMESEIEGFVSRVLKGKDVSPQETAILPDVLRILKHLPEHAKTEPADRESFRKQFGE